MMAFYQMLDIRQCFLSNLYIRGKMSMYSGTNPTALQSQRWIADSLTGLMLEKSYARITIQDICKRADLSRQTFYNFFNSKESIFNP